MSAVQGQAITKMLVFLLAVCCLVPLAALAAVFFLAAPVWLVTLVGLLVLALLGWRLMMLLAVDHRSGLSHVSPQQRGLSTHDHD